MSARHPGITTLEVWLIGTPHQVADAMTALAAIGRIVQASRPQRLHGNDTGRIRRYACVAVSTGRREVVA